MDPISMDTATSPTNPDPRFPRPRPPSAASPLRQRATQRGIRAGVVARAYQLPCGQGHEARRRRGDGRRALSSSWPTGPSGGDDDLRSHFRRGSAVRREDRRRPAVDGPGERRCPASSDDRSLQSHADSEMGVRPCGWPWAGVRHGPRLVPARSLLLVAVGPGVSLSQAA